MHGKIGQGDQKPGRDQSDKRGPRRRGAHIVGRSPREHTDDFAGRCCFRRLDRVADAAPVFRREMSHHQLPEAPPPPDDPPPPEKPPPDHPPPEPPRYPPPRPELISMPSRNERRLPRWLGGVSRKKMNTKSPGTEGVERRILADDAQLRVLFPLRGIRRQNSDDVVDAALDAAAEIPRLEAWRHRIANDAVRVPSRP